MANLKRKATTIIISVFLMSAIAISLVALPVNGQTYTNTYTTYAYIGATPNPVGVGQEVLLHAGITQQLGSADMGYTGITITVITPSGDEDTLEVEKTDSTGGTGYIYVPDEVGTYTLQTHFPEQEYEYSWWMWTYHNTYYASESEELELIVQEDPIEYYPDQPLPSEYWTRPIDSQLRSWTAVSGNWLYIDSNRLTEGNDYAPDSAHILWSTPMLVDGGLAGGTLDDATFYTGDAYEGKWGSSTIIAGKLYYADNPSQSGLSKVWHCVDLHTGEELWAKTLLDNQTISFGQIFQWESYNGYGSWAYLWVGAGSSAYGSSASSTWTAFDAYTGDWRCTITGVPTGTIMHDDSNGNIYVLKIDSTNGWMALWNWSALFSMEGSFGSAISGKTVNASANTAAANRAWAWNVTIETGLTGSVQAAFLGDKVIGADSNDFGGSSTVNFWALSLEEDNEGDLLYDSSYTASDENVSLLWSTASQEDEVFVLSTKETRKHYGFDSATGELLFTTDSETYLQMWYGYTYINLGVNIAYGNLYSAAYGGIVYCYDAQDGELLWTYEAEDPYTEIQWSNYWPLCIQFFADGKVYLGHHEHSVTTPSYRGAPYFALNATTGEVVWRADGLFKQTVWGGMSIIGDSIIATMDTYDLKVYAIGKGPSATTASAPDIGVALGSSVVISGTVMDVSPGTTSTDLTLRFPNGVPAVSDESMSDWMLYVYKQFERPDNATGVEVVIYVLDANGNYYEIGRTNSSSNGYYSLTYTPTIPGIFNVYVTFEGSDSYYSSSAETSFVVEEAPEATAAPTPTPAPMTDTYVLGLGIGSIIAIVAVGLLIILMLRKR
ncbi:PQQ-like beta-propeller repeat protein [Candidatus Bathyarchaeota archaeon]|nr:PQQ-like beta-propeller repeat protein [Candidatus Bathyarchaeota archaeon]